MITPRKSIDDSDLVTVNQQSSRSLRTKDRSITKRKSMSTGPYQQLKDPCRILNYYVRFRCSSKINKTK